MRTPHRCLLLAALLTFVLLCACQGVPKGDDLPKQLPMGTDVAGPRSGKASSDNQTNDIPVAGGYNVGGTQNNNAVTAKVQPSRQNTGSGHLVTGFVMGQTAGQVLEARQKFLAAAKDDPALKSIADEIAALMQTVELTPEWQTRVDALRGMYAAARDGFIEKWSADAGGGAAEHLSMSSLTTLVNIGIISGNVGHDERAPTNVEALGVASALPRVVKAARGLDSALTPGEQEIAIEETVNEILGARDLSGLTPEEVEATREKLKETLGKLFGN